MRSLSSLHSPAPISEALAPFQSSAAQPRRNTAAVKWTAARVFLSNNQRMVTVLWVTIYPESPFTVCAAQGWHPLPPPPHSFCLSFSLAFSAVQTVQAADRDMVWRSWQPEHPWGTLLRSLCTVGCHLSLLWIHSCQCSKAVGSSFTNELIFICFCLQNVKRKNISHLWSLQTH